MPLARISAKKHGLRSCVVRLQFQALVLRNVFVLVHHQTYCEGSCVTNDTQNIVFRKLAIAICSYKCVLRNCLHGKVAVY